MDLSFSREKDPFRYLLLKRGNHTIPFLLLPVSIGYVPLPLWFSRVYPPTWSVPRRLMVGEAIRTWVSVEFEPEEPECFLSPFLPLVRYPWRKGCLPPPDPIQPKRKGRRTQKGNPSPFRSGSSSCFHRNHPFLSTIRFETTKERKIERGSKGG